MSRFALYFIASALMVSLLPLRVQAALPKELPASPAKFLTGACLTRSEDLWITAEAGDIGNVEDAFIPSSLVKSFCWVYITLPPWRVRTTYSIRGSVGMWQLPEDLPKHLQTT